MFSRKGYLPSNILICKFTIQIDITFASDIVHNLCKLSPSLLDVEVPFDYNDEDAILDVDENDNTEHNEPLGFIKIGLKQEKKCVLSWNSDTNPKRLKNKRQVYGPGIYSSPDPDFASDGWYAEHFQLRGKEISGPRGKLGQHDKYCGERTQKSVSNNGRKKNIIPTARGHITLQDTVVAEEYNANGESNVQFSHMETTRAVPPVNLKRFW